MHYETKKTDSHRFIPNSKIQNILSLKRQLQFKIRFHQ
jgi:hypothetical protein